MKQMTPTTKYFQFCSKVAGPMMVKMKSISPPQAKSPEIIMKMAYKMPSPHLMVKNGMALRIVKMSVVVLVMADLRFSMKSPVINKSIDITLQSHYRHTSKAKCKHLWILRLFMPQKTALTYLR